MITPREQIELILYRRLGENWKRPGDELTVVVEQLLLMIDTYADGKWMIQQKEEIGS